MDKIVVNSEFDLIVERDGGFGVHVVEGLGHVWGKWTSNQVSIEWSRKKSIEWFLLELNWKNFNQMHWKNVIEWNQKKLQKNGISCQFELCRIFHQNLKKLAFGFKFENSV